MKRTTLYLEPDLEIRLKLEAMRRKKPMAEVIREALRSYLGQESGRTMPPGGGAFSSGHGDTAEETEDILKKTGFGENKG
jgi:hypothetical protein